MLGRLEQSTESLGPVSLVAPRALRQQGLGPLQQSRTAAAPRCNLRMRALTREKRRRTAECAASKQVLRAFLLRQGMLRSASAVLRSSAKRLGEARTGSAGREQFR